ncbi:MAG: hypothetical protein ACMUIP_10280 [bacterium]
MPGIYYLRDPKSSPLWRLLNDHFETFERNYEEKFDKKYGYWRPVIKEDGIFTEVGAFYVAPDIDLKPLEEIFRANALKMLKKEGKINDDVINNLLNWRHSGFSVDNGVRIARDDEEGQIALAQYILRNT